jgi:kynurenine formamidase
VQTTIWFGRKTSSLKSWIRPAEIRILQQAIGFANKNPNSIASEIKMGNHQIIDLSVPLIETPPGAFPATEIVTRISHEESAKRRTQEYNLPEGFFPDNKLSAYEIIKLNAHSGTHLDAPWHYGPMSMGKPAKTIDQVPLEWCYGDGVILDLSHIKAGELITVRHLKEALNRIKYELKPYDIVLIRTDASKRYLEAGYDSIHPGMGRKSTIWLIRKGIRVMGIDAKSWDRPRQAMVEELKMGIKGTFWQAHLTGREMEYCHLENLANLDAIPMACGFKVAVFPIKLQGGSAGWVRAVAIVEEK